MSKRDEHAASLAAANDGKDWETMRPVERDVYRAQADREGFRDDFDPTDASDAVGPGLRGRLDDLAALFYVIDGDPELADQETLEGLDIGAEYDDHELQLSPTRDDAEAALREFPGGGVDIRYVATITIGGGGPGDWFEVVYMTPEGFPVEIDSISYHFAWGGTHAERKLSEGSEDYATAERFARQVVPELVE